MNVFTIYFIHIHAYLQYSPCLKLPCEDNKTRIPSSKAQWSRKSAKKIEAKRPLFEYGSSSGAPSAFENLCDLISGSTHVNLGYKLSQITYRNLALKFPDPIQTSRYLHSRLFRGKRLYHLELDCMLLSLLF
jgi:hypothetical protein